jgi:alpha-N-acetylglucosaminidase
VIVAFPDVEPSIILNEEKLHKTSGTNSFLVQQLSEKNLQDEISDVTYEKPHLWYSTADVINALQTFLDNGEEVSDIPTFRQGIQLLCCLLVFNH